MSCPAENTQDNDGFEIKSCLIGGALIFVLALALFSVSWRGVFLWVADAVLKSPTIILASGVALVFFFCCVADKSHLIVDEKIRKWVDRIAPVAILVSALFLLTSLVSLVMYSELPSKIRYQEVMTLSPGNIGSDTRDGQMSNALKKEGQHTLRTNYADCQTLVDWTPEQRVYEMTVNDKPVEKTSCRKGLNTFTWKYVE